VWFHNLIKAYGMVDFAKERYGPMEDHLKKYDMSRTKQENIIAMGPFWVWSPGCGVNPALDYSEDLVNCPAENRDRLMEAIKFVHAVCAKDGDNAGKPVPLEWETAYDMRPWTAFPERG